MDYVLACLCNVHYIFIPLLQFANVVIFDPAVVTVEVEWVVVTVQTTRLPITKNKLKFIIKEN